MAYNMVNKIATFQRFCYNVALILLADFTYVRNVLHPLILKRYLKDILNIASTEGTDSITFSDTDG